MRDFLVSLSVFAVLVAGYYFFVPSNKPTEFVEMPEAEKPVVIEPNVVRRNVTPDSVLPAPVVEGESLVRLPAVVPPPPPPKPPEPKGWTSPEVISAGVLKSGDTTVILKDIDPVELDKKCALENGATWPCGMFARTEMRQFVRGRPIECDPVEDNEAHSISTRCRLGNFDMSAWLVLTGWAEPKNNLFQQELEEAKQKQRGQWRQTSP